MEVRENFSPKGSLIKGIPCDLVNNLTGIHCNHFGGGGIAASNSAQCEPAEECQCVSSANVKSVESVHPPPALCKAAFTVYPQLLFPSPNPLLHRSPDFWSEAVIFVSCSWLVCLSPKLFLNGPVLWICLPSLPIPCCPPLGIQVLSSHSDQQVNRICWSATQRTSLIKTEYTATNTLTH